MNLLRSCLNIIKTLPGSYNNYQHYMFTLSKCYLVSALTLLTYYSRVSHLFCDELLFSCVNRGRSQAKQMKAFVCACRLSGKLKPGKPLIDVTADSDNVFLLYSAMLLNKNCEIIFAFFSCETLCLRKLRESPGKFSLRGRMEN